MVTKVQKWGNSLAVRLPKKVVVRLGLQQGNPVEVKEQQKQILIRKVALPSRVGQKIYWKRFIIPTNRKKERVSERIDEILYGESR